jgi:AcrR family transcriptional regulator
MAKNKRPQDRQEKHDEIVAAARSLFLDEGFDAVSMARLAAAAGIAPNTIYWYFKDKDEVLATVLSNVFSEHWLAYLAADFPKPIDKLLWFVARLQEASILISTVHTRLRTSSAIHIWHDNFHLMLEALIHNELMTLGVLEADVDALTTILIFTIEGLLIHQSSEALSYRICETLLRQLKLNI